VGNADAEKSAGFAQSAVMVRKTGPCEMAWPLTAAQLVTTAYPA
jgi:hypothetical protein